MRRGTPKTNLKSTYRGCYFLARLSRPKNGPKNRTAKTVQIPGPFSDSCSGAGHGFPNETMLWAHFEEHSVFLHPIGSKRSIEIVVPISSEIVNANIFSWSIHLFRILCCTLYVDKSAYGSVVS